MPIAAHSRRTRWPAAIAAVAILLLAVPAGAAGKPRVRLTAKPAVVTVGDRATLSGVVTGARAPGRYSVVLQEHVRRGWVRRSSGGTVRARRLRAWWRVAPGRPTRTVRVRVLTGRRVVATSAAFRVRVVQRAAPALPPVPAPPAPEGPGVTPPPVAPAPAQQRTQVIAPGAVASAPPAGSSGVLRLTGDVAVQAGDIVASGIGPAAPYGFLFRATAVRTEGGDTLVDVRPATLREAVPEATIHETFQLQPAERRTARSVRRRIPCTTGGEVVVEGTVDLGSPVFAIDADWGILSLNSVKATTELTATMAASASASGAASCTVGPVKLLDTKLRPITFPVAGIPVTLVPEIEIELSGLGEVQTGVSTSVNASLTAKIGAEYEEGDLSPIAELTPSFTYAPPDAGASGRLAATLTPSLEIAAYGVGGPEFAINAGPELNADPEASPWWTLDVPVSFTAALDIDILDVEAGPITVYEHRFRVAQAAVEPSAAATLSAGEGHTCGVRAGGTIRCWGENQFGELGNGTTNPSSSPVDVAGIADGVAVSAGHSFSCALRSNATIACWGRNVNGEHGNGTTTDSPSPTTVTGISDAVQVDAGAIHTCAVRSGGTASCWGHNLSGRLGNGTTTNSATPVPVSGISDAVHVAAGTFHTCALRATGRVSCWGDNFYGSLGNGSRALESSTPVEVVGITDATGVSAGQHHACALRAGGSISCWGDNEYGQLGDGTETPRKSPVAVVGISDAVEVAAYSGHTCARHANGSLSCWGYNYHGELGDGSRTFSKTPVAVTGVSGATQLAVGYFHTCALQGSAATCWGQNVSGELGRGTTSEYETTPAVVTGFP